MTDDVRTTTDRVRLGILGTGGILRADMLGQARALGALYASAASGTATPIGG
jgi:hypothetical protein